MNYVRFSLLRPLNLQFFAADNGGGDGGTATGAAAENTAAATTAAGQSATTEQKNEQNAENKALSAEDIKKLIQSSTDRATAELGKQIAALKKENSELKKQNMSAEEVKKLEAEEREKTLAAREKDLLDRENRLFAIKAIKEIGLDDGSERALSLVDFVMAEKQEDITERVKAFNALVQGFVSAKVDEKFKSIGRTPNGAAQSAETKKETSVAETLGKRRAEQAKQSNDVLNMYLGGKK